MRKSFRFLLLGGCALLTNHSNHALKVMVNSEERAASNISFLWYEDEEMQIPVLDEDENTVIVTSDEDGNIPEEVDEGYLLMQETPGYYLIKDPISLEAEEIIVDPIHFEITCEKIKELKEDITVTIWKEEEEIVSFLLEEYQDVGTYLLEDVSYRMEISDIEGYIKQYPETFTVTKDAENKLEISFLKTYQITIGVDSEISGTSMLLYEDEECTVLLDEILLDETQQVMALPTGTYWYQWNHIPDTYYVDETVYQLNVKEEDVNVAMRPVKPVIDVEMNDSSPYMMFVYDQNGELVDSWINTGQMHSVNVKREQSYFVYAIAGSNYYSCNSVQVDIGMVEDLHHVFFTSSPIEVSIKVIDMETGKEIKNAIAMENRKNGNHFIYQQGSSLLYENDTLHYSVNSLEDGYICAEEGDITLSDSQSFHITLAAKPYTKVTGTIEGASRYQFYTDEACTKVAKDIYHDLIPELEQDVSLSLFHGTYYYKQIVSDSHYYADHDVHMICLDGKQSLIDFAQEKVVAVFQAKDSYSQNIVDISMMLLDENEEWIQDVNAMEEVSLEAGKKYRVRQKGSVSGYQNGNDIVFQMADVGTGNIPKFTFYVRPYRNISFGSTFEVIDEVSLFTDETCFLPAKDIYGNAVIMNEQQNQIQISPGIYYAKQNVSNSYYFKNDGIVRVDCREEDAVIEPVELIGVQLEIGVKDNNGHFLSGIQMSLLDDRNAVIYEWETGDDLCLIPEGILETGKTYWFRQNNQIDGYVFNRALIQYTVGEYVPDSKFLRLIIANQKEEISRDVWSKTSVPDMEEVMHEKENLKIIKYVGISAGILILGFALCKLFQKMKKH